MSGKQHRLRVIGLACAILVTLSVSYVARAQNKTPITHEAMWLLKRLGAPSPSPDGKWVVFSLIEPAYDEKDQVSDLWIDRKSTRLNSSHSSPSRMPSSA